MRVRAPCQTERGLAVVFTRVEHEAKDVFILGVPGSDAGQLAEFVSTLPRAMQQRSHSACPGQHLNRAGWQMQRTDVHFSGARRGRRTVNAGCPMLINDPITYE